MLLELEGVLDWTEVDHKMAGVDFSVSDIIWTGLDRLAPSSGRSNVLTRRGLGRSSTRP
jgi:hypothetical protein